MTKELLEKIRRNPEIYSLLREESYHYKYLLRDEEYLKEIEKRAKEKYKIKLEDRIENLKENINLINTFLNILK